MPIIGLSFTRIEGKRMERSPGGEIRVNSTPGITEVKEVAVQSLDKKALSMDFEFVSEYAPGVGKITVEGNLLYIAEDNAPVLAQWKKDKSLPEEVSVPILNHLFRKCLVKISAIAEDLNLPPPLQMPMVQAKAKA